MKLKKSELNGLLLTMSANKMQGDVVLASMGLLHEKISLGLKRRLQKITKEAHGLFTEYQNDLKECNGNEEEIRILNQEEVTINQDMVSLAMIEAIETEHNYDWELIEKIAQ